MLKFERHQVDSTPTHLFAIVTRCFGGGLRCLDEDLDTMAFIFPQELAVSNCLVSFFSTNYHYDIKLNVVSTTEF